MISKFKRLLGNLPFNPSLIGKVAFYAKHLKREAAIRRLGFIFIALAVFIQTVAILNPPKASVQASLDSSVIEKIETTLHKLPEIGSGLAMVLGFSVTAIVAYFFMRAKLMNKELELVRNEYKNSGNI